MLTHYIDTDHLEKVTWEVGSEYICKCKYLHLLQTEVTPMLKLFQ